MEGFDLISTGAWSIVPPLLALGLALITKEVYSSLTIGVLMGMVIYQFTLAGVGVDQFIAAFTMVPRMMATQIADNGALLLFLALLGALTVVIAIAGGSRAYAEWVSKHVKNARLASILTAVLGILIFVDDYFNCLTVGAVMRPITDRFHISREKLSWIIDSTAAPVCIIAPVSSWAVAVGGYLGEDGFSTFVQSIPYNFYALLTVFFVFFMLITKLDYGSMRTAEEACAQGHDVDDIPREGSALAAVSTTRLPEKNVEAYEGDHPGVPSVVTEEADIDDAASGAIDEYKGLNISENGRVFDLIVPIVVLIVFSILGMMYVGGFFEGVDFATAVGEDPVTGLCIGSCVALVVSAAMFLPRKLTTLEGFVEGISEGVRSMVGAIINSRSGVELGRPVPSPAGNGRVCERRAERAWRGAYPSACDRSSWWRRSSASPWALPGHDRAYPSHRDRRVPHRRPAVPRGRRLDARGCSLWRPHLADI